MSTSRNGIIAGGNWIVDAVKMVDVWPQQDTLANILSTAKGSGGSPFNILVDLALLGAKFPLGAIEEKNAPACRDDEVVALRDWHQVVSVVVLQHVVGLE